MRRTLVLLVVVLAGCGKITPLVADDAGAGDVAAAADLLTPADNAGELAQVDAGQQIDVGQGYPQMECQDDGNYPGLMQQLCGQNVARCIWPVDGGSIQLYGCKRPWNTPTMLFPCILC